MKLINYHPNPNCPRCKIDPTTCCDIYNEYWECYMAGKYAVMYAWHDTYVYADTHYGGPVLILTNKLVLTEERIEKLLLLTIGEQ